MSDLYLLPCECGQTVTIEPRQAGERVRCACGRTSLAPSMSRIRSLPRATTAPTGTGPAGRRGWTRVNGAVFVIGVLLATGGFALAGWSALDRRHLPTEMPESARPEAWHERIDSLSLEESWGMWNEMRTHELQEQHEPLFVAARRYAGMLGNRIWWGLSAGAAGSILAVGALVVRPRQPAPAR